MRTKLLSLTAAGLLAIGGVAVAGPALAANGIDDTTTAVASRVDRLTQALAGLVADGSITQEQADEVATTLDAADLGGGHRGGPGGGHDLLAAATALSMTEDALRAALQAEGATLASVAQQQGVATDTLVDAIIEAGRERITQKVSDGDLTQEQADERLADLEARITDRVNSTADDRPQPAGGGRGGEAAATATGSAGGAAA